MRSTAFVPTLTRVATLTSSSFYVAMDWCIDEDGLPSELSIGQVADRSAGEESHILYLNYPFSHKNT
jgi:hypothetical protein